MSASKDNHLSQVRRPDGSFGPMIGEGDDVDALAEQAEEELRQHTKESDDFDSDLAWVIRNLGRPIRSLKFPSGAAKYIFKFAKEQDKAFMPLVMRYQDKIAERERSEKALKDDQRRQMKFIESLQITSDNPYDTLMDAVEWWYRTHDADMEKPDWLRNAEELAV